MRRLRSDCKYGNDESTEDRKSQKVIQHNIQQSMPFLSQALSKLNHKRVTVRIVLLDATMCQQLLLIYTNILESKMYKTDPQIWLWAIFGANLKRSLCSWQYFIIRIACHAGIRLYSNL